MRACMVVVTMVALAGVACVGPARDDASYSSKSGRTADSALSAVNTARLAADVGTRGLAFGPYLSVTISGAEESLRSTQSAFDGIQPPDATADALRNQLDPMLTDAVNTLTQLRIAVRRNEVARLGAIAAPLQPLAQTLDTFSKEHP
jgi:hypothetical protein